MGPTRDGDLRKLREELEAEKSGVCIPAEIRWLGGAMARARFQGRPLFGGGSGDGGDCFWPPLQGGVRLFGSRYEVDAFAEAGVGPLC